MSAPRSVGRVPRARPRVARSLRSTRRVPERRACCALRSSLLNVARRRKMSLTFGLRLRLPLLQKLHQTLADAVDVARAERDYHVALAHLFQQSARRII